MLTMEMVLHKDVDFAPKFGKNLRFTGNSLHSCHRDLTLCRRASKGWQESCHCPYTRATQ